MFKTKQFQNAIYQEVKCLVSLHSACNWEMQPRERMLSERSGADTGASRGSWLVCETSGECVRSIPGQALCTLYTWRCEREPYWSQCACKWMELRYPLLFLTVLFKVWSPHLIPQILSNLKNSCFPKDTTKRQDTHTHARTLHTQTHAHTSPTVGTACRTSQNLN